VRKLSESTHGKEWKAREFRERVECGPYERSTPPSFNLFTLMFIQLRINQTFFFFFLKSIF
jgi:hypothetical protein